jgi:CheY-like chemotaxis protein
MPSALVVAEDDNSRRIYAEYLRRDGWSIDEASTGVEALVKALNQPPDIIVAEIWLPGISGRDLCRLIRQDPATASIPIVIVTANASSSEIERVKNAGATSVVTKAWHPETVASELRRLLGDAAPQRVRRGVTKMPPIPPPTLRCPVCGHTLRYEKSYVSGPNESYVDQWDYFWCPEQCGLFQYRPRTGKIRRVS